MPAWVVLELVPTKLPHYALPLYPALALLAASALVEASDSRRWARWTEAAGTALWALVTLSIVGALILAPIRYGSGIMMAAVNSGAAVAVLAAMLYLRPNFLGSIVVLAALSLALVVPAASWVVPNLDRLWLSRAAAGLVARHEPPTGTRLTVIGYTEPSLVFLLRDQLRVTTASAASALSASDEALVNNRDSATFEQGLAAQGLGAQPIDNVAGIDYSNGQSTVLTLYQVKAK
jgi:4-amino-4-deoxy-L-arabinose transferase-like glycosyltransferase